MFVLLKESQNGRFLLVCLCVVTGVLLWSVDYSRKRYAALVCLNDRLERDHRLALHHGREDQAEIRELNNQINGLKRDHELLKEDYAHECAKWTEFEMAADNPYQVLLREHAALRERFDKLTNVALALGDKMVNCTPYIMNVCQMSEIHGVPYAGPTYMHELKAVLHELAHGEPERVCRVCNFAVSGFRLSTLAATGTHLNALKERVPNDGIAYCPTCEDETLILS